MARWLTVLIALVAQGLSLMSPVCFVRCTDADGHVSVELTGQDCHCQSPEHSPEVRVVATCGHHHEEEKVEHDALEGWQVRCEHCSCQHSPLETVPQTQSKSLSCGERPQAFDFVTTLDFVAANRALEKASLRPSLLRPQESAHLAVLATVVLRM